MPTATRKPAGGQNGAPEANPPREAWQPKGAAAKLAYIQTHVTNVEKTGYNDHHKYAYFQEHGLLDLVRPLLRELHCAIVPSPTGKTYTRDGNRAIVVGYLDFIDTDEHPFLIGEGGKPLVTADGPVENPLYRVRAYFTNEGVDSQDKATNKALTGWMKYALQKLFAIPTEAVDDADNPEVKAALAAAGVPVLVDRARADELVAAAAKHIEEGRLDAGKFKAKLNTLRVDHPAKLTTDQFDGLVEWMQGELG